MTTFTSLYVVPRDACAKETNAYLISIYACDKSTSVLYKYHLGVAITKRFDVVKTTLHLTSSTLWLLFGANNKIPRRALESYGVTISFRLKLAPPANSWKGWHLQNKLADFQIMRFVLEVIDLR